MPVLLRAHRRVLAEGGELRVVIAADGPVRKPLPADETAGNAVQARDRRACNDLNGLECRYAPVCLLTYLVISGESWLVINN